MPSEPSEMIFSGPDDAHRVEVGDELAQSALAGGAHGGQVPKPPHDLEPLRLFEGPLARGHVEEVQGGGVEPAVVAVDADRDDGVIAAQGVELGDARQESAVATDCAE